MTIVTLIPQETYLKRKASSVEISQEQKGNIHVVNIIGRLDASTANELEEALEAFNSQEKIKVVVNFKELEYISSAGLRVLLASAKHFKKNHSKIALAALNPNVKQVFEISGFTSIFEIFESLDEAIEDLNV